MKKIWLGYAVVFSILILSFPSPLTAEGDQVDEVEKSATDLYDYPEH